jgi:hypothetical protein
MLSLVTAAFQHVRENIEDLNGRVGAHDTDLIFLKGLMDSPIMRSLVKVSLYFLLYKALPVITPAGIAQWYSAGLQAE